MLWFDLIGVEYEDCTQHIIFHFRDNVLCFYFGHCNFVNLSRNSLSIVIFVLLPILAWPSAWASETCCSFNLCCHPRGKHGWDCQPEGACILMTRVEDGSENILGGIPYGTHKNESFEQCYQS